MAAGDVTIKSAVVLDGADRQGGGVGNVVLVVGKVQLDGGNPTPVALARFGAEVLFGLATIAGSATPGVGAAAVPYVVTANPNGSTLDVRAFANTLAGDATPLASTEAVTEVNFVALVRR